MVNIKRDSDTFLGRSSCIIMHCHYRKIRTVITNGKKSITQNYFLAQTECLSINEN